MSHDWLISFVMVKKKRKRRRRATAERGPDVRSEGRSGGDDGMHIPAAQGPTVPHAEEQEDDAGSGRSTGSWSPQNPSPSPSRLANQENPTDAAIALLFSGM
jgi:hypothetical protein